MTPEQRRRNRRTGIILAIFAAGLVVWTFIRGDVFGIGS